MSHRGEKRPVGDIGDAQAELRALGLEIGWTEGDVYRVRLKVQKRTTFLSSAESPREAITKARLILRALERALPDARGLWGPTARRGYAR